MENEIKKLQSGLALDEPLRVHLLAQDKSRVMPAANIAQKNDASDKQARYIRFGVQQQNLLKFILDHPEILDRAEIARQTKIPRATVYRAFERFEELGLSREEIHQIPSPRNISKTLNIKLNFLTDIGELLALRFSKENHDKDNTAIIDFIELKARAFSRQQDYAQERPSPERVHKCLSETLGSKKRAAEV